jgi:TrmH family RNA methyltransferase
VVNLHTISSSSNEKIKRLKSLYTKKGREENNLFVVEGEKFIAEISCDFIIDSIFLSESYYEKNNNKLNLGSEYFIVKDNIFKSISDTVNPQGIIAVVQEKQYNITNIFLKENPFLIIAENIQDPGNMGSLIRSSDAFGADCVVACECADIYSPKVIRATAGSIFHIPVIKMPFEAIINILKEKSIKIIGTYLKDAKDPEDINFKEGSALIIGNEGAGISLEAVKASDAFVKIPMSGRAESLNASVASGVLLYEVQRQRNNKKERNNYNE